MNTSVVNSWKMPTISAQSILDLGCSSPHPPAALSDSQLQLQRYLEVTDGGIHACARFSTRYEATHLVEWLYYHKRVGISFFHLYVTSVTYFYMHILMSCRVVSCHDMKTTTINILTQHRCCILLSRHTLYIYRYFDKTSSNLGNPLELKALSIASKLPFVKIYDVEQMDIVNQGKALMHCIHEAHLERKGEWVVDFDIDEVFAFGDPVTTTQDCDGNKEYHMRGGELSEYVATLPETVLGIILPRFDFGQNGHKTHPPNSSQMQVYTRRADRASVDGKVMRRTITDGRMDQESKHWFWGKGLESGIYPNGKPARLLQNCTEDSGLCPFTFGDSDFPAEEHLKFPRLHHYTSRSLEDCQRKITDSNATWRMSQSMANWRFQNAHWVCGETQDMAVEDYSVYCDSKKVSEELNQLFPLFRNEPGVN